MYIKEWTVTLRAYISRELVRTNLIRRECPKNAGLREFDGGYLQDSDRSRIPLSYMPVSIKLIDDQHCIPMVIVGHWWWLLGIVYQWLSVIHGSCRWLPIDSLPVPSAMLIGPRCLFVLCFILLWGQTPRSINITEGLGATDAIWRSHAFVTWDLEKIARFTQTLRRRARHKLCSSWFPLIFLVLSIDIQF